MLGLRSSPSIHLCDPDFTSRCAYHDVYVLPAGLAVEEGGTSVENRVSSAEDHDSSAKDSFSSTTHRAFPTDGRLFTAPLAVLRSRWLLRDGGGLQRAILGWRCRGCAGVEANKTLLHCGTPKTSTSTEGEKSKEKTRAKLERARARKEAVRRRALQLRAACADCWNCPRCGGGGETNEPDDEREWEPGGIFNKIHEIGSGTADFHATREKDAARLAWRPPGGWGVRVEITPGMRYRVGCAYCRWQGCTDFESLEEVNRYLDELTATRAAPLRGWRIAHRAANERIRRAYGRSTLFPPKTTSLEGSTSVSFSTIAWDRYVELRRPPRQQPPPPRVREAAPSPHHGLTETEVEEETRVFDEIARMNEAYMSNPEALNPAISSSSARLHPAVALEKLRALYTNRAIRRVADDGALEKQPPNFPNYVVEMKCRDVYPSENREKKELESIYNQRPAFSDEACWIAAAQQAQWGLHPSFIATAPDAETLRRIFSSYSNSLMSGGNDEGGMSGITPLRGLRNPFAASLLPAPPPTIAELPTTQAGSDPALQDHSRLDLLLRDTENRKFGEGLTNYFPARLLKEGIAGTVLYSEQDGVGGGLKVDEFAKTSIQTEEPGAEKNSTSDVVVKVQDGELSYTAVKKNRPTRTLIILDRSSQEEDVKQSLEYWQSHLDHPESDLASLRSNPRCNIVFANHFNAVRVLPYLQYVISSRLAKAHGEDDESSDVGNPSKSLVVLSFRFINLGMQEMVIRRVRVARRHLGGGKHYSIELSSRYTQIFHPTITPPPTLEKKSAVERNTSSTGEQNGWVRLLPRCSREEAAVANFTDYAAVELPSDLAANCIDATTELRFDITLNGVDVDPAKPDGVDSGFKAPHSGLIYVGLAIDAFTFLDTSPFSCGEEVFPSSAANGYYAISFGNTIVW